MSTNRSMNLLAALLGAVATAGLAAQPTAFTYQGELRDNGQPASGLYDLQFTLYDAASQGSPTGDVLTHAATTVGNGLFTVTLDFGPGVFTGEDRWLEIGVRDGGSNGAFEVLGARQPLTPAPYALHAYSVTASNVNGVLPDAAIPNSVVRASGPQIIHGPVRFEDVVEFEGGNGGAPFSLSYGDVIPGLNAALLGSRPAEGFWQTGGNAGTTPGTHSLGTTDNQPIEFKVNGRRALRLEPTPTNGAVNVIAGSQANYVIPSAVGVTISGGGSSDESGGQIIEADFATIGGGSRNQIGFGSAVSLIGGGEGNEIGAHAPRSVLGGGKGNKIASYAYSATIGGGQSNTNSAQTATIGGGANHFTGPGSTAGTIGGGVGNAVHTDVATIGGGYFNSVSGRAGTIGGGWANGIETNANEATISGGVFNTTHAAESVIGGGRENRISEFLQYTANHATIGGGYSNIISGAQAATIAGGSFNEILAAPGAVVAGGGNHHIGANAGYATIAGGYNCRIGEDARSAFAAGYQAQALHAGTFVWADRTLTDFPSTGINQFLVRATGGVGINTSYPAAALDVRVVDSEAASIHIGGELANGLGKLIYFGDIPYVSIGEQGVDDQMVLTAGSFYFDNRSNDGRVGIGRSAEANKLEVEGDASKTTAGLWLANSDRRVKRDIRSVTNALETLARVRPVAFRYSEAYRAAHPGIANRDYVNVVAQEFAQVFPDYVKSSGEPPPEGIGEAIRQVDTYPLLIYGTAAIQELNEKLEIRCRIAEVGLRELRAENAALKARLDRLETLLDPVALDRPGGGR